MKKRISNDADIKEMFLTPGDERALLFYAMHDINTFYDLSSKISVNDFLRHEHALLFAVLASLQGRNVTKFDLPLVINAAQSQGVLDTVGGVEYLQLIYSMEASKSNYPIFLENVLEASTKYKLYRKLNENVSEVEKNSKEGKSSSELIGIVESGILDLSTESKAIKEPINVAEGLREWIEERKDNPIEMTGLDTGYPILNKQIDGLIPGTLFIIAARKKMGKSAFLTNIAMHVAYKLFKPVLYIDTELSFAEWRPRVLANLTGIEERIIKHGGYTKEQYISIQKGIEIIENGRFFHEYMPGYNVDKLIAVYKKFKIKEKIELGVFDYIKEPDLKSIEQQRKGYQILGDVTTKLKDLSGELNIPFITAVQLNRQDDIADSDRIARYGDIIAEWKKRSDEELEHVPLDVGGAYKLIIRDTRRGGGTPEGGICYKFFKPMLRVREVPAPDQLLRDLFTRGDVVNNDSNEYVAGEDELL
jgi:replicative DNA helicase